MKLFILKLFLLTSILTYAQNKSGNLLLLKIDKTNDLKIDKKKCEYIVVELDSAYNLLKNSHLSRPVYFKDFSDNNLLSCVKKDSISLKTLLKGDTFDHDNKFGLKNFKMIENNSKSMNYLMKLNITSTLYNQKINISYTLINCNYCIGTITKYDSEVFGYIGEVVLVNDNLTINNEYKISNENLYSFIKSLDFNSQLF